MPDRDRDDEAGAANPNPNPDPTPSPEPNPNPDPAPRLTRADFVLLRRASRANWGVPDVLRTEALYQANEILADEYSTTRDRLAAMKFLLSASSADLAAEKAAAAAELARLKLTRKAPADATHGDGVRPEMAEAALRVLNAEPDPEPEPDAEPDPDPAPDAG